MKVFISWSGDRSRAVAELLDDWIQCVIQAVDPWMSSKDIDRGALWFSEINNELANTSVGIICLTKENKNKPWILFESGALAKGLSSSRVCTFLIDLESTDLENPLAQFNHTSPTKVGLYQLVRTINFSLQTESLKDQILEKVFETYWPQFEERFNEILESLPVVDIKEKRNKDDILIEVLSTVRTMDKRMRELEVDNSVSYDKKRIQLGVGPATKYIRLIQAYVENGMTIDNIRDILRREHNLGEERIKMYMKIFSDREEKKLDI